MAPHRPLIDRILAKTNPEPNTGCWLWDAAINRDGYGIVGIKGRSVEAHSALYKIVCGEVPPGLELDHKCRVRCCVNPDHLEPVTHHENMSRSSHATRTHCPSGHPYSGDNLLQSKHGRFCRACNRLAAAKYKKKRRVDAAA